MADSRLIVGEKLSRLSSSYDPLQEKDVFVFSHYSGQLSGYDYYDYTKKINYQTLSSYLYEQIMPNLLDDRRFMDTMYQILSAKLLNDEKFIEELSSKIKPVPVVVPGIIKYNSCYPEEDTPKTGIIKYNSCYRD